MSDLSRVAVLGAGLQGCCVALSLAKRGYLVDLYEKSPNVMSGASYNNEGKIHLGYLFAAHDARLTAAKMIEGAVDFSVILSDLLGQDVFKNSVSSPFTYLVHKDSILDAQSIQKHFLEVDKRLGDALSAGGDYLGAQSVSPIREVDVACAGYNTKNIVAAFETPERSIDPHVLAHVVRRKLNSCNGQIRVLTGHYITRVEKTHAFNYSVISKLSKEGSEHSSNYSYVVNALWSDRLRVDKNLGIKADRNHVFRYKLAIHADRVGKSSQLKSSTLMLGPFGDMVQFGNGRMYLSWYPSCLIGHSNEIVCPDWENQIQPDLKKQIFNQTLSELKEIRPDVAELDFSQGHVDVQGGVIFSWGDENIGDRQSEIHHRYEIGVNEFDGYYSIDTGKLGMAPKFANEVTDLIAQYESPCLRALP